MLEVAIAIMENEDCIPSLKNVSSCGLLLVSRSVCGGQACSERRSWRELSCSFNILFSSTRLFILDSFLLLTVFRIMICSSKSAVIGSLGGCLRCLPVVFFVAVVVAGVARVDVVGWSEPVWLLPVCGVGRAVATVSTLVLETGGRLTNRGPVAATGEQDTRTVGLPPWGTAQVVELPTWGAATA